LAKIFRNENSVLFKRDAHLKDFIVSLHNVLLCDCPRVEVIFVRRQLEFPLLIF
jgi:hypothetical protein